MSQFFIKVRSRDENTEPEYWSQQIVSASQSNLFWNRGSVGIGVPLPLANLQIDGNCGVGAAYSLITPPSNGLIVSGNVGIGTTNPLSALHVNGTVKGTSFEGDGSLITDLNMANINTGTLSVLSGGTGATAVTGSGSNVLNDTPTLITPIIGAATGTSLEVTGAITSSGGGIGYATGAGGTVTQTSSRTNGVTLNKLTGTITLVSTTLAANATNTFTLTNSFISSSDHVFCTPVGESSYASAYLIQAVSSSGSAVISIRNVTSSSATESPIIKFTIFRSVTS